MGMKIDYFTLFFFLYNIFVKFTYFSVWWFGY